MPGTRQGVCLSLLAQKYYYKLRDLFKAIYYVPGSWLSQRMENPTGGGYRSLNWLMVTLITGVSFALKTWIEFLKFYILIHKMRITIAQYLLYMIVRREPLLFFLLYRWENWDSERWSDLLRVTQWVTLEIQWVFWFYSLGSPLLGQRKVSGREWRRWGGWGGGGREGGKGRGRLATNNNILGMSKWAWEFNTYILMITKQMTFYALST